MKVIDQKNLQHIQGGFTSHSIKDIFIAIKDWFKGIKTQPRQKWHFQITPAV
tara:strand:+ start:1096 stop:1251 length:156 start_codon:yes stop_codon:yes gene_type:complete